MSEIAEFVDCGAGEEAFAEVPETLFSKADSHGKTAVGGPARVSLRRDDSNDERVKFLGWWSSH